MTIERAADAWPRRSCSSRRCSRAAGRPSSRGEVIGVIGAGAFVGFDGFEGLLPVRRLRGDWWELDELGRPARSARSRASAIRLGRPADRPGGQGRPAARARGPLPGRGSRQTPASRSDAPSPEPETGALPNASGRHPRCAELHERARRSLFGGVPMPWMMLWAGGYPVAVESRRGQPRALRGRHRVVDLCLGDTGAMAGHAPPPVLRGAARAARDHDDAAHRGRRLGGGGAGAALRAAALAVHAHRHRREPDRAADRPAAHRPPEGAGVLLLLPRLGRRGVRRRRGRRDRLARGQRRPAGRPGRDHARRRVQRRRPRWRRRWRTRTWPACWPSRR